MQPGSLWQQTPSSGGKLIVLGFIGSALIHGGLFLTRLPEPKPPELPKPTQLVMIQPKPKVAKPPEPKKEPPKPVEKKVVKQQPQKAKATRKILSSKAAPNPNAGVVSANQIEGSKGTGYGTEKGDDKGSTSPVGVDNGDPGPPAEPPPPPPPPPPPTPAKPKGTVQPDYPEIAQQNNWEGRVIVKAFINPDGSVGEVTIAKSSGHDELDQAAIAAVRRTAFEPARRGDETVGAWVRIPITFSLQ